MSFFIDRYIRKHWLISGLFFIVILSLLTMTYMGTLSYPYIMAVRQVQMYRFCKDSQKEFTASDFGFKFEIPDGFCFLPNREYPKDTTVQVLPSGLYFVLNEYIKGTVISNTKATIIFEPVNKDRNIDSMLDAMKRGGFLIDSKREDFINKNGVKIILLRGASSLVPEEKSDWAFVLNKKGSAILTLLLNTPDRAEVFNYIVENLNIE